MTVIPSVSEGSGRRAARLLRRPSPRFLATLGMTLALAAAASSSVLVQYSFDDGLTDTGPDTFAVFQNAKGHVRLVSQIRYSGYRAIELRDVKGDGDFPELQGYFPERAAGELFFHFAMLVANPEEPLNIALAGRSHFSMTKDGIAFWLKTRDAELLHVSDSIPKRLFKIEPFVWYVADVRYDIDKGTYDLTIRKEGTKTPVVALTDQPNATHSADSSVDKFSFVGSVFEDDSDVTYYVDDVVIGTDENIILGPFVAPGRRKLFIDRWREAKSMMKQAKCPPALSLADFGVIELRDDFNDLPEVTAWRSTCAQMERDPAAAAKTFARLAQEHPDAPIFALSEVMALVRANEKEVAMQRWGALARRLEDDVRYGMVAATMGIESEKQSEEIRYFVMLWKEDFARAARFAEEMAKSDKTGEWLERAGDALFLSGAAVQARPLYETSLQCDKNAYWPTVKLSDIAFLLGDPAGERAYREKMYGALRE
jgi:hypothetical protein